MNSFTLGALGIAFQIVWLIGAVVVFAFMLRLYMRTRLSGFLWLMLAVVVWPIVARVTTFLMPMLLASRHGDSMSVAQLSVTVFGVESLLGVATLLVAVITLDRQLAVFRSTLPVSSGSPPYQG